jgi:hypothetical protein
MTFDSVYEMFNPLTDVRDKHFWDWFSGNSLNSRWTYSDKSGSNHDGSRFIDDSGGGFLLKGAASSNITMIGWDNIRPFSHTGSVVIWTAKMHKVGTGYQGAWGTSGFQYSDDGKVMNGMKINVPQSSNCGFYTMHATSEGGTDIDAISNCTEFRTYKMEQLDGSATCSVDGTLVATRDSYLAVAASQPFAATKFPLTEVEVRFCEAYNT